MNDPWKVVLLSCLLALLVVAPGAAGLQSPCAEQTCEDLVAALDISMDEIVADMKGHLNVGLEEAEIQKGPEGSYYLLGFERDFRDHRLVSHERMEEADLQELRRAYWARILKDPERKSAYMQTLDCAAELKCLSAIDLLEAQYASNGLVAVAAAVTRLDFSRGIVLLREAWRDEKRRDAAVAALAEITQGRVTRKR